MAKKKKKYDQKHSSTSYVNIEENASQIFTDYLNKTDWSKVPPKKEVEKQQVIKKKREKKEFSTIDLDGYTLTEAIGCIDLNFINFIKIT